MREGVSVDDLGELDLGSVEDAASCMQETPAGLPAACATPRVTTSSAIRALTVEELPLAARYGADFYVEARLPGRFDPDLFIALWTTLLNNGSGVILGVWAGDEFAGALAAMVAPDIYDGRLIAMEFFWYTRPEYRRGVRPVRLIQAYEAWAIGKGVRLTDVRMAAIEGVNDEQIGRLYRALGYRPLERQWGREA